MRPTKLRSGEIAIHVETRRADPPPVSETEILAKTAPRKRLLVFAYACEPERGSEPGAGWGLVQALATFTQCTVLVGPEHIRAIEKWTASHPNPHLRFVEVSEEWIT